MKWNFTAHLKLMLSHILILLLNYPSKILANPWLELPIKTADQKTVEEDLSRILTKANLQKNLINLNIKLHTNNHEDLITNKASILCTSNSEPITIKINALNEEWSATFYNTLQQIGFYFPHPRIQLSPTLSEIKSHCGKTFDWKPSFRYRGFHLHTMHPNEWTHGFLMGKTPIADDFVRWLARNNQNVFDFSLLRIPLNKIAQQLTAPVNLANQFGIQVGYSLSFALTQQKSYKLIPLVSSLTGIGDSWYLKRNLIKLQQSLKFDFLSLEAGTTEFTAVNYERALKWMELARSILKDNGQKLFMKVHVSTNQHHPTFGNFNFLPQYSHPDVGVLPHTVMFYSLYDDKVPMYGNQNFNSMLKFTQNENLKRSVWYYPETSYWIAMDVDAPLFLTDYLVARAKDMKELSQHKIEGHFNFTSGHENGYWLFDWTIALNTNSSYKFDPMIGLKLLGESSSCWSQHLNFQTKHFKNNLLISILSFPNLQDELSRKHRIHERNLVKELKDNPELLQQELETLELAKEELPSPSCIKQDELKSLIQVTYHRILHAYYVRKAIENAHNIEFKKHFLTLAKKERLLALSIMASVIQNHQRYPEASLYDRQENPTSYSFGYLWTSANLHFWELEEKRVTNDIYHPFYMNIYNFLKIIF